VIRRDPSRLDDAYDVLVIGGGVSGVCVAREAALRGLTVLLVDKGDFGAGTSSATTKYIHGGIRYLEQREFAVVRESLRERRRLALAAPHLVRHTRFLLPVWRWSDPGALLLGAGVATYDVLSFDRNQSASGPLRIGHPSWLGRRATLQAVPWLAAEGLRGAYAITDTMNIHPERLLLAMLLDAVGLGAVACNHVEATGFVTEPAGGPGRTAGDVTVRGVELRDRLSGRSHTARARVVVNAGGPWMDVVLRGLGRPPGVEVRRSKGVHVLTPPLGGAAVRDAVLARAPSGRHVIVSPWMGYSFIGPTDTPVDEEPDDVRTVREDVDEILGTVNACTDPSSPPLTHDDVLDTAVGIRPLVVEPGRSTYETSRRHVLHDHAVHGVVGLWSIGGGKWTTARALGEDVVDTLLADPALRTARPRPASTVARPVHGAFGWAADAEPFLESAARRGDDLHLDPDVRLHLARLYGTDHEAVLELVAADRRLGHRVSERAGRWDIGAQVAHAVVAESARTLADIVDRRLVLGTLGPVTRAELERVAEVAAPLLGWDDAVARAAVDAELERRAAIRRRWAQPTPIGAGAPPG
jgi:glycerol-3-phosphate dehydrogenase